MSKGRLCRINAGAVAFFVFGEDESWWGDAGRMIGSLASWKPTPGLPEARILEEFLNGERKF